MCTHATLQAHCLGLAEDPDVASLTGESPIADHPTTDASLTHSLHPACHAALHHMTRPYQAPKCPRTQDASPG
jgi:hypothetical protein